MSFGRSGIGSSFGRGIGDTLADTAGSQAVDALDRARADAANAALQRSETVNTAVAQSAASAGGGSGKWWLIGGVALLAVGGLTVYLARR